MNRFGVIFDVDGVLVDSYAPHYESWRRLGKEVGFEMSLEQFNATFGRTSREIIRDYWPHLAKSDEQVIQFDRRKEDLYREILETDFAAMEGAVDLIDDLTAADFGLAVGSSGPPENVQLVLEKLGRRTAFSVVVTGMDVTRGKPDPQVFALAAERLNLAPYHCTVIEDAAVGVQAAKAAGCRCVGLVCGDRDPRLLEAADLVVRNLRDLSSNRIAQLLLA